MRFFIFLGNRSIVYCFLCPRSSRSSASSISPRIKTCRCRHRPIPAGLPIETRNWKQETRPRTPLMSDKPKVSISQSRNLSAYLLFHSFASHSPNATTATQPSSHRGPSVRQICAAKAKPSFSKRLDDATKLNPPKRSSLGTLRDQISLLV